MITHSGIKDFLDYVQYAKQSYKMALGDSRETNDETQDILHMLELSPMEDREILEAGRHLIEIRKKRRIAKDSIAVCELIAQWAEENQKCLKSLECLLGNVRKAEKNMENRIYIPRTSIYEDIAKEMEQHG